MSGRSPVPLTLPPELAELRRLRAGNKVVLNGILYTARDAAHKIICDALSRGEELPFAIRGQVIYYVGPTPARSDRPIGSAGPTTSGRMDRYTPALLRAGLAAMVGKGQRSSEVVASIRACSAVYFAAVGGTGAFLSQRIVSSEITAFPELGTEAVHRLMVKDFPVVVAVDCLGNSLFEMRDWKHGISEAAE